MLFKIKATFVFYFSISIFTYVSLPLHTFYILKSIYTVNQQQKDFFFHLLQHASSI